jgi:ketosteroid isomerase-like protein
MQEVRPARKMAAHEGGSHGKRGCEMSVETNKRVASDLFARFSDGDVPGVLAMMTGDATWKIPGRRPEMPTAGVLSKDKIARVFYAMLGELKDGRLKMKVKGAIAEGDQVAVEAESWGELKNGRVYNQEYHFLITLRDGKISAVREYLDTQHAFLTWFRKD